MDKPEPRKRLPVYPGMDHLQKQAKRLKNQSPGLNLADAQHWLAREYGCKNWEELAHMVETMRRGGDQLANVKMDFEALPAAARAVDITQIRRILQEGNFTRHDLDQALSCSLWYGEESGWEKRKEIADLLLEHGADPDGEYGSNYGPIVFGTGECLQPAGLQYLIDAGADVTFAPIDTKYGLQCPLSYVLGTYVRGRNERKHAMIEILLRHNAFIPPEVTPPILAIHRGDAAALTGYLKQDASLVRRTFPDMPYGNISLSGATLLHCAVEFGEIECLDVLFAHQADINQRAEVIHGIGGQTPVFHAINTNCDGNFHVLEYLVSKVGTWIDMTVLATWRAHGENQTTPMTPLEYARSADNDDARRWRKKIDEELNLLLSLDQTAQIKAAILCDDPDAVCQLLDEHDDLLTPALWPPAIFEAKSFAITDLLLKHGLDPNLCTAPRKPLHLAVYQCLPEIVELLIAHGADVNLRNPLGETPLDLLDAYDARPVGDPDSTRIRKALLAAGAEDSVESAVRAGDLEALCSMLEKEPSLAQSDAELGGPLFAAARSGRPDAVRLLLEFGADPNRVNEMGNTPLWFCCQSSASAENRLKVAQLLIDAGADINKFCEEGSTALHYAAWRGPAEMVELLLANGAKSWIPNDQGKTPLEAAKDSSVALDKDAVIQALGQPRIKDPVFREAVEAMTRGDLEELSRLLQSHPGLVTAQAEENGEFAGPYFAKPYLLEFAAENPVRSGKLPANICQILRILIEAGSPRAALDKTLALAASGRVPRECGVQSEMLELLVKYGADPAIGLDGAVSHGEKEAIETLLRLGAVPGLVASAGLGNIRRLEELLPKAARSEKEHALNAAIRHGMKETTIRIIEHGGIGLDEEILDFGTPLHHAAFYGNRQMCEWLLELGADPGLHDRQWNGTPAGWAEYNKHPVLAKFLNEALQSKNADKELVEAVVGNDLPTVRTLLDAHPEKIHLTGGPWNKPLLHCAAWEGHLPVVRELLDRGADVNERCASDQACAIHFAAEQGHLQIVKALLDAGSEMDAPDNDHQQNVLGWATSLGKCQHEVAEYLLACGATLGIWSAIALNDTAAIGKMINSDPALIDARMSKNEFARSLLHHAVQCNRPEVVELLLELGADPLVRDTMGVGLFGMCKPGTDRQIVHLLEDRAGELTLRDAIAIGRLDQAEELLASDPASIRPGGKDAGLFVNAVCRQDWKAAEWLLAHGADINSIVEVYQCPATALHFAIESAPLEKVQWLLERGADPTILDGMHGADALGWAAFLGKTEVEELLRTEKRR